MKWREVIRKSEWVLIPLIIALGSFLGGMHVGEKRAYANMESVRDTVVKVVTVYKDFPQAAKTAQIGYVSVPAYKFLSDTVTHEIVTFLHDTTVVYLPREQRYYEEDEGRLRLWVSGYDPRLDRYELDRVETTITNTITPKRKRWGLGVHVGYGACICDKRVTLSPEIGIGITYNILSF